MKNVDETSNHAWKNILRTVLAVILFKSLMIMYVHHHRQQQYKSGKVNAQIVLDTTEIYNARYVSKTFDIYSGHLSY